MKKIYIFTGIKICLISFSLHAQNVGINVSTPQEPLHLLGRIRLGNSSGGYVNLQAGSGLGSVTYSLPTFDGNPGDVLTTNGFGVLSWTAGGSGGSGSGGGGTTINCSGSNSNHTVRGTGSGYECTDAIWITSTGRVGIGTTSPSSSFDLSIGTSGFLVTGSSNTSVINGRLRIGSGTTSTSYDLEVDGTAVIDNLRVGTTSSGPSGGIISTAYRLSSSTSGSGTALIRTSSGDLRPSSSTLKVKENIRPLNISTQNVLKLRPVIYNLKPALGGEQEIGLIAEEVETAIPELVIYGPARQWIGDSGLTAVDENGDEILDHSRMEPYSVAYDRLPVILLEVIREQQQTIQQLEERVRQLEEKVKNR